MQDQVLRANKIIRTLLDFSRQKGQQAAAHRPEQGDRREPGPGRTQVEEKEHHLPEGIPISRRVFHGFPTRLQQLFINLFINAIDAMTARRPDLDHAARRPREEIIDPLQGQRPRHPGKTSGKDIRPVLHHQGDRQGDGSRPFHRLQHRQGALWQHRGAQQGRPGHHVHHHLSRCKAR